MINNVNPNKNNENIMPYGNNMAMPSDNNMAMPYDNTMAMPYDNTMAMPCENIMPYGMNMPNTMAMPYENMMPMPNQGNVMPYENMMAMPQPYNPNMVAPQFNCPMSQFVCPMPIQPMHLPMVTMDDEELEKMYPKTYNIVNPVVQSYCDKMDVMSNPTKEQLDEICEKICKDVEGEVDKIVAAENKENKRQLGFGGRFILRDLTRILLLRELIRRRRFFGYPGYGFPGYGGFYGY